ncbi:MAG: hypothetical protein FWH18_04220 [Marinilabiliaceae bacterium]|nr:hypothetical protein [Marinilabiliaceae bacterium]
MIIKNAAKLKNIFEINKKNSFQKSSENSLKMINVTGNEELGAYIYDYRKNEPVRAMGSVSIPNISYKIEF